MPSGSLADSVKSGMQFGVYGQLNLIVINLGINADYISMSGKTNSDIKMKMIPLTASLMFSLPTPIVSPYAKIGGGIVLETLTVPNVADETNQDPVFLIGAGVDIDLMGTMIKIEGTYNFIYEKNISGATENGSYLKLSAGLGFSII